jgi:hypothetical protein
MRIRGKISLLLEGLSQFPLVPASAEKGLAGRLSSRSFPHDASALTHVAYGLRSNGFGLTCAKFEGAGGNTWQNQ